MARCFWEGIPPIKWRWAAGIADIKTQQKTKKPERGVPASSFGLP
jgi:hypothetical protein